MAIPSEAGGGKGPRTSSWGGKTQGSLELEMRSGLCNSRRAGPAPPFPPTSCPVSAGTGTTVKADPRRVLLTWRSSFTSPFGGSLGEPVQEAGGDDAPTLEPKPSVARGPQKAFPCPALGKRGQAYSTGCANCHDNRLPKCQWL